MTGCLKAGGLRWASSGKDRGCIMGKYLVSAALGAQVGGVSGGGRGNVEVFAKWRDVGESSVNCGDRDASSVNDAGMMFRKPRRLAGNE